MSSFAIVLLSETVFGGAQRRFLNLHCHFRKRYGEKAWFITTQSLKAEALDTFGESFCEGIIAIGEKPSVVNKQAGNSTASAPTKTSRSTLFSLLKSSLIFDIYYYLKTKKRTQKQFLEIEKISKEKNIDRFLAVYSGILPLYFYFDKPNRKERIVFSNMDSWLSHFEQKPIKRFFHQFTLFHRAHEESDHVDILSPFIHKELMLKNILPTRQSFSITACSFIDYSKCKSGDKSQLTFAFSGRLEADKNPVAFLQVALNLGRKYPEVKFLILGKGRLENKIKELLSSYQGENIKFEGYVKEPCTYFAETSVFVSLQKDNNYPSQSVLEAMACGNAVIASNVGDTSMFINEQNGWLIENNIEELSKCIEYCILHPEEVKIKGDYAFNYVRDNFSIERASNYYYNLLFPNNE